MPTDNTAAAGGQPPFARGSMIWRKAGPLPMWAWGLILLGVALAWSLWRRNRAAGEASTAAAGEELPGDQTAPPVFVVPQAPVSPVVVTPPPATVPPAPPGGGRELPPAPPKPPGGPKPPPGRWVTVVAYSSKSPSWASTISGIAKHFGIGDWRTIWTHPVNAPLRKSRSVPERIRPGDRVWVPGK